MSSISKIEWTEKTWNPVAGCTKISPGCDNCIAIRIVQRLAHNPHPSFQQAYQGVVTGKPGNLQWSGKVHLLKRRLNVPRLEGPMTTILVGSLCDILHEDISDEEIDLIFGSMAKTPDHTYLVLTKRSERLSSISEALWWNADIWAGVSVENEQYAYRIDDLRACAASSKFLVLEPLLGPLPSLNLAGIDWVIVGGESGPRARQMKAEWARDIRDQCVAAGVPFFFKQWGCYDENGKRVGKKKAGRLLDGRQWDEMPG